MYKLTYQNGVILLTTSPGTRVLHQQLFRACDHATGAIGSTMARVAMVSKEFLGFLSGTLQYHWGSPLVPSYCFFALKVLFGFFKVLLGTSHGNT